MLGEGDAGETAAAEFVRDLEEEDDIGDGGAGATSAPVPPLPLEAEAIRDELARVEDFVRRARVCHPQGYEAESPDHVVDLSRLVWRRDQRPSTSSQPT